MITNLAHYVGIDIAAYSFVAACQQADGRWQVTTHAYETAEQIELFVATLDAQTHHCVVEATGRYHHRLVAALGRHSIRVSVVNPLTVKRYAQMLGSLAKTDKADAKLLARYGQQQQPPAYVHRSEAEGVLSQKRMVINKLAEHRQALQNQCHALRLEANPDAVCLAILEAQLDGLAGHLAELRQSLDILIAREYAQAETLLKDIPGFGTETIRVFIEALAGFDGWREAANAKAFVKYVGLAPSVHESGKSVRGGNHISRSSVPWLRNKLWLPCCTLATRMKTETPFKTLYVRLRGAGKSYKEALIAVMHKLVRVALAVLRSGVAYQAAYAPPCKENLALCL
jgi:transposase